MTSKMLKAYSFLFYLICLLFGFFLGVSYAVITEAGKDQMLAAGAIVIGYGVISAIIAFILSLFASNKLSPKTIIRLNILLSIFILGFTLFYKLKFDKRQKEKVGEVIGYHESNQVFKLTKPFNL